MLPSLAALPCPTGTLDSRKAAREAQLAPPITLLDDDTWKLVLEDLHKKECKSVAEVCEVLERALGTGGKSLCNSAVFWKGLCEQNGWLFHSPKYVPLVVDDAEGRDRCMRQYVLFCRADMIFIDALVALYRLCSLRYAKQGQSYAALNERSGLFIGPSASIYQTLDGNIPVDNSYRSVSSAVLGEAHYRLMRAFAEKHRGVRIVVKEAIEEEFAEIEEELGLDLSTEVAKMEADKQRFLEKQPDQVRQRALQQAEAGAEQPDTWLARMRRAVGL